MAMTNGPYKAWLDAMPIDEVRRRIERLEHKLSDMRVLERLHAERQPGVEVAPGPAEPHAALGPTEAWASAEPAGPLTVDEPADPPAAADPSASPAPQAPAEPAEPHTPPAPIGSSAPSEARGAPLGQASQPTRRAC
jgi:uncharacterized membrane protein